MFVPPIDYYPFRYSSTVKPGSVLDIKFWSASDFTSAWFTTSLSTSLESSGKEIPSQNNLLGKRKTRTSISFLFHPNLRSTSDPIRKTIV